MRALHANQAVRMGLKAASRNPELAFGKTLLDLGGNALSAAPVVLAALLITGALEAGDLLGALRGLLGLRWPVAGALLAAAAISFFASALFWAGALPVLAADAEMDARPPAGNFARLLSTGAARVTHASLLGWALSFLQALASTVAVVAGAVLFLARPSNGRAALAAAAIVLALLGGLLVDLLARLLVVRAAALGEGAGAALGGAARLLGERLGACVLITLAFGVLELVAATAWSALLGSIGFATAADEIVLQIAPRIALSIAFGAVFAWLEVGRQGALAALAANDAGLLEPPAPPPPREPVPTTLLRPERYEAVIEALPVPPQEEPVIEALPLPPAEEPVIEAQPVPPQEEPVIEALPLPPPPDKPDPPKE